LSVVMGDGGEFRECATFRADHSLLLEASKGLVVDWLSVAPDRAGAGFQAVTRTGNPYGLALHGVFASSGAINGDAVNDRGLTFKIAGRLNAECVLEPRHTPDPIGSSYPRVGSAAPYGAFPMSPRIFEPSEESVAGRLYEMRLYYGGYGQDDCYRFAINGVLVRSGAANLTWGMNDLNAGESTFQAVGSPSLGTGGVAAFGQRMPWGELRVHGLENDAGGLRAYVGSGRETHNCID
jgi:hypothetical protein